MVEAKAHDPNILPHMYDHEVLEEMFPLIEVSVEIANDRDWIPGDCFWEQQSRGASVDVCRRNCTIQPERCRGVLGQ